MEPSVMWAASDATAGGLNAPLTLAEAERLQFQPATSGTIALLELAREAGVKQVWIPPSYDFYDARDAILGGPDLLECHHVRTTEI